MELGNTGSAISHYTVAVKKDPGNATYLFALGTAYLHDSDYDKAARVLHRAADLAPDDPDVLEKLAFAYRKLGDDDRAIEVYWRLFSSHPDMTAVYEKLLSLLEAHERFDEAAEATLVFSTQPAFDKERLNSAAQKYLRLGQDVAAARLIARSLELDDSQGVMWRMLGEQQLKQDHTRAAIESFSHACALDPADVAATVGWADALRRIGQIDQARERYERALSLDPDLKGPRIALVEIYLAQDRLDEAASFAREALMRFPHDPSVKALKGAVHIARQEWSAAVSILSLAASRSEQEDPRILAMLGQAHLGLGERTRARRCFTRALACDPDNGEANLGLCQLDLEDQREAQGIARCERAMLSAPELRDRAVAIMTAFYEARERYRKVIEVENEAADVTAQSPESSNKARAGKPSKRPQVSKDAQRRIRELEEARELIEAIPEEERSPRDWYDLGEICVKLEDLEAAEKALTRAWKADPDNLQYRMGMADVLLAERKFDSALVHFREIVRLDERNVTARYSLVQALLGRGDFEETVDILRELRELDAEDPRVYELSAEAYFELGLTTEAEAFQRTATEKRTSHKSGEGEQSP